MTFVYTLVVRWRLGLVVELQSTGIHWAASHSSAMVADTDAVQNAQFGWACASCSLSYHTAPLWPTAWHRSARL